MQKQSSLLAKYIPNTITLLSLCCGLSAIRFSIINEWQISVFLIIIAGVLDFFDGWFAKKLRGEGSNFGAELDSLSDVISFGVAPSILIYLWSSFELGSIAWSASLFFVICSALRLARFTTDIYLAPKQIDSNIYFVGVPSPGAAGLCILPVFLFLEFDISLFKNPYFNIVNLLLIGFMMISKIPTFSLKAVTFNRRFSPWIILLIAIICIGLLSNLRITLIIIGFAYIFSIIFTILKNYNFKN